jgi:hypothetical protein
VSEGNAHGHDATDLRLRSGIQITLFGVVSGGHLGNQIAEHIGGFVRASTMDGSYRK